MVIKQNYKKKREKFLTLKVICLIKAKWRWWLSSDIVENCEDSLQ